MVFGLDIVTLVVIGAIVLFLLAVYLMFRRTALAFREGFDGRR
ncbi:hypothetical protein ACFQPA_13895 [Halomarina halobia]|uniref:Uncharacterized protein n=1 Tax=Halomarina halobia TaxID=3033386 RepID=A0ABD6A906_9EURY|nr:hypothetical protein [Halomarina sp. PSR21]